MAETELSKAERVKKFGEVFTPARIVGQMLDSLEAEAPEVWEPGKTFLDPCCGDGAFTLEILRRKFERCRTRGDYSEALRTVWAMDIQAWCVEATIRNVEALCGEYFRPTKADLETIRDHVIQCDSLKIMRMINELRGREDPSTALGMT